ncbi:RuBisCO large subunit C-terminal-like domain-containing protein [Frigidibacter mobilis]|nr:RuBisCO large subunit C-terminal-like domain-containing protein [Frigidibacter mobilis]
MIDAEEHCLQPMGAGDGDGDDRVMPIFSSGQWAGTLPHTLAQAGSDDLMFLSGGGIMAHPGGPAAGLASVRQAHEAVVADMPLADHARTHPELAQAIATFGARG